MTNAIEKKVSGAELNEKELSEVAGGGFIYRIYKSIVKICDTVRNQRGPEPGERSGRSRPGDGTVDPSLVHGPLCAQEGKTAE